jgi:Protein of unknown function (DUF2975)
MNTQTPDPRLRRQARFFGILARWAAGLAVLAVVTQVLGVAAPLWHGGPVAETLENTLKELALTAPALFYAAGLVRSRRVFGRIGRGEIFVPENCDGLVAVGGSLLLGALWAMIVAGLEPAMHSGLLGPLAHDIAEAAIQLALAALGLALLMLGRIMRSAVRLKTEADAFV